jgi:hypothetical protein
MRDLQERKKSIQLFVDYSGQQLSKFLSLQLLIF